MTITLNCQINQKEKDLVKAALRGLSSAICSLSLNTIKFLGDVVANRARGGYLYATQATLGKRQGCCEKTINRASVLLQRLGLIEVEHRPYTSNVYSIPGWFYNPQVQEVLKKVISSIRKLSTDNVRLLKISSYNSYPSRNKDIEKRADAFQKSPKREEILEAMEAFKLHLENLDLDPPKKKESWFNV